MNEVLASTNQRNVQSTIKLSQMIEVVLIHLNGDQNYTGSFSCINLETVSLEFVDQRFEFIFELKKAGEAKN